MIIYEIIVIYAELPMQYLWYCTRGCDGSIHLTVSFVVTLTLSYKISSAWIYGSSVTGVSGCTVVSTLVTTAVCWNHVQTDSVVVVVEL